MISSENLRSQVDNTALWALSTDTPHARVFKNAEREPPRGADYFRLLLAAHFTTVATFVPTDVDARIRFHEWQSLPDEAALRGHLAMVDEVAKWDARLVSARVLLEDRTLSGHDGEWLGVYAGALGRSVQLGCDTLSDEIAQRLDEELQSEAAVAEIVLKQSAERALAAATIIAHNLGDLSRVVEAWPGGARRAEFFSRYVKLGHAPSRNRFAGIFFRCGAINKALAADENHRFLPLREPRILRTRREVILPIGPFFDAWGEILARQAWPDNELGNVLAALLSGHTQMPTQHGYLRAIAGMHRALRGGIDRLLPDVPARLRKVLREGPVRAAIDLSPERFAQRMEKSYATFVATLS